MKKFCKSKDCKSLRISERPERDQFCGPTGQLLQLAAAPPLLPAGHRPLHCGQRLQLRLQPGGAEGGGLGCW